MNEIPLNCFWRLVIHYNYTKKWCLCIFFWVQNHCVIDFKLIGKNNLVYYILFIAETGNRTHNTEWECRSRDQLIISDSSHSHLFPRLKVISINQASEFESSAMPSDSEEKEDEKLIHQIKTHIHLTASKSQHIYIHIYPAINVEENRQNIPNNISNGLRENQREQQQRQPRNIIIMDLKKCIWTNRIETVSNM